VRIHALTIDYPPARWIGSEVATHIMLRHLVGAGHQVNVFTTTGEPGTYNIDGVTVTGGFRSFLEQVGDADVFFTHVELGPKVCRFGPTIGITHNARETMRDVVAGCDWALLVHNANATAEAFTDVRRAPFVVVNPPVDWRDWRVNRDGADAITMVNVTGEKGSATFYELAARMPHRRFVGVVGGWGEPDIRPLPNVDIVEHGADMRRVYAQTRVLLMPSEHESWGRVAVEAMSSGIPVVATDLPGVRECVGAGGVLVELDWFDEYERQIIRLDNPDVYGDLSAAATLRAVELDPTPQLDRFTECVEAVAKGSVGPWDASNLSRWVHVSGRATTLRDDDPHVLRFAKNPNWEMVA
jgi:glycosyltransferase involved in cell wall biosynthesis